MPYKEDSLSEKEKAIFKSVFKEALVELQEESAKGSQHLNKHKDCPFSDEDVFVFKRFKRRIEGVATAIGMSIILSVVALITYLIKIGIEAWRAGSTGP